MLLARLVNRQDYRGHHAKLRTARNMYTNDMDTQIMSMHIFCPTLLHDILVAMQVQGAK